MNEGKSILGGLLSLPPIETVRGHAESSNPDAKEAREPRRSQVSVRIRADLATALRRASLQRELDGVAPHTLQEIIEQALEPCLRANGHIR